MGYTDMCECLLYTLSHTHILRAMCVLCVEVTPTHVGVPHTLSRSIIEKRKHEDVLWGEKERKRRRHTNLGLSLKRGEDPKHFHVSFAEYRSLL